MNEPDSRPSSLPPPQTPSPSQLPPQPPLGVSVSARSGLTAWLGRSKLRAIARAGVLVGLVLTSFFAMILGLSTVVAEHQFGVRREKFLQAGVPVVETVRAKKRGRRYRYLVIAPAGTRQFEGEPQPGDGRWVRVYRPAFERFHVGDSVDLLRMGDDYLVRDDVFVSRFQPSICLAVCVAGAVAAAVVWKVGRLDA